MPEPVAETHASKFRLTKAQLKELDRKSGGFHAVIRKGYHLRVGDENKEGPFDTTLSATVLYANLHKVENKAEARKFLGLPVQEPRQSYVEDLAAQMSARASNAQEGGSVVSNIDMEALAVTVATATAQAMEGIINSVVDKMLEGMKTVNVTERGGSNGTPKPAPSGSKKAGSKKAGGD